MAALEAAIQGFRARSSPLVTLDGRVPRVEPEGRQARLWSKRVKRSVNMLDGIRPEASRAGVLLPAPVTMPTPTMRQHTRCLERNVGIA